MVAHVHVGDGTLTLDVVGANGTHFVRDHVAREPDTNTGGMLIQGMWRFPPTGGQSILPEVPKQ